MSDKFAAKESLKIINEELKKELNLIPLENENRKKIQSFAIESGDGKQKQFTLVTGNNNDAKQTRIITEKIPYLPAIKGVELKDEPYKGGSIERPETSIGFSNHLRSGNQTSFIIANPEALKKFIRWYSNNNVVTESGLDKTTLLIESAEGSSDEVLLNDYQLKDILNLANQNIEPTTKEQLIKARLGQGKFRQNVIKTWGIGECCLLTGIEMKQLLIASHIIPWCESNDKERINGTNGILLCSHFDKLFDQYIISFNTTGQIEFSKRLSILNVKHLENIGIHSSMKLNTTKLSSENRIALFNNLKVHRDKMIELDETFVLSEKSH